MQKKNSQITVGPTQGHTDKLKQHSENITINKMLPELCLVSHTSYKSTSAISAVF